MNIRIITAATVMTLTAAGSCWAQEAESDAWMNLTSPAARAEVRADRNAALAEVRKSPAIDGDAWMQVPTVRTRAAVRAELRASRLNGEFQRLNAEAPVFDDPGRPDTRFAKSGR